MGGNEEREEGKRGRKEGKKEGGGREEGINQTDHIRKTGNQSVTELSNSRIE